PVELRRPHLKPADGARARLDAPSSRELSVEYEAAWDYPGLEVLRWGAGPPAVLIHGGIVDAERCWRRQRPLAGEWELRLPNRPGFGASPPLGRSDFEAE